MPEVKNPPARLLAGKGGGVGDEGGTQVPLSATQDSIVQKGESQTPQTGELDECSIHASKMRALAIGNEIRSARADIKRRLRSGEQRFDELITNLPVVCRKVPIGKLVQWAPGVKAQRALWILNERDADGRPLVFDTSLRAGLLSAITRERIGAKVVCYQNSYVQAPVAA